MPPKKDGKKETGERIFIQFSSHITLKRKFGRSIRKHMYIFVIYLKAFFLGFDIQIVLRVMPLLLP